MKRVAQILGVALLATGLSACGPDYGDLPLPGSKVAGETYSLGAVFDEALNLAQGAQVKVNGVPVGRVQSVTAKNFQAVVDMDIKASVELREGSTARLRYDTPLGELFIQIKPAKRGETLADNAVLNDKETTTAPTVEDTLAQASLLINGGGLGQLQNITEELNTALGGREEVVRRVLARANTFLGSANESTDEIDQVLRSLAAASKVLAARQDTINRAVTDIRPASEALRENTDKITEALDETDKLTATANRVLSKTRTDTLQVLGQLDPILQQILSTRPQLVPGLKNLVRAADLLKKTVPGDYLPFDGFLSIDDSNLIEVLGGGGGGGGGNGNGGAGGGGLGLPSIPGLPDLPALLGIPGLGLGLPGLGLRTLVDGGEVR